MDRGRIRKLSPGQTETKIHNLPVYFTGTLDDCNIMLSYLTFRPDSAIFGGGYWEDTEGSKYYLT